MAENNRSLRRIMYVDDDPDLRIIARISLEKKGGFTVLTVDSGRKAIQFIPGFRPDLVIMDVIMPEMDGRAVLQEIKSQPETQHIPVVFLTSKLEPEDLSEYNRIGASGVLHKPFHPSTLAEQVRTIWQEKIAPGL